MLAVLEMWGTGRSFSSAVFILYGCLAAFFFFLLSFFFFFSHSDEDEEGELPPFPLVLILRGGR